MGEQILKKLESYPDVSFIGGVSFAELQEQMIRDYEGRYRELTGKDAHLAMADPYRLILYSCAVAIYQGYQYEDRAGKMGLLKYSTGEFLDNLCAMKGVTRNGAKPATATLRLTLAKALSHPAAIPKGTRAKGGGLYWETTEEGTIPPGGTEVDVLARCQVPGACGNGYAEGEIKTLVDPLPYTLSLRNIKETSGGADRETDQELAERAYLAPSKYSTAGPAPAYEYWAKTYSQSISECLVTSEAPGEVDIYITVDGGIPDDSFIKGLEEYLGDSSIRPLTDKVVVKKPEKKEYGIKCTYYISRDDCGMEESIKSAVEEACGRYISWQKKIGRDITPSRLVYEIMQAGAQSVDVAEPAYTELSEAQMAVAAAADIAYGGMRDG